MSTSDQHAENRVPVDKCTDVQQAQAAPDAAVKASSEIDQPARKGPGLLSHWLRRREPQQHLSTLPLTVKTETATVAAGPSTPTWSESSEASDFASVEALSSPAALASSSSGPHVDSQGMGQPPQARLAGRLGGWLTGVTSAAGVVLGGAVRGGTKALQRLTAQERLQDLHAASQHLEATASGLGGEVRVRTLQRWCAVLHELHPSSLPLLHCYTLHALSPSSPHRSSCDSDWQQLHFLGPDAAAPNAGLASANETPPVRPQKGSPPAASAPSGGGSRSGPVARGPELDFWANQVLYLDQESPDNERNLLTFRELFLHSYALENIIVGYMDSPASLPEDRSILVDLFGLCLAGDAALHTRLVDALLDLSAVEAECRVVGTAASLGPEQPPLANVVAEAICGIKLQAECEVLDRKMATLKADIGDQAAEVHRSHKFNSGATEPTGESSPTKLASGLVGTAEVMQLGSKFQKYSVQRASQAACRLQPGYDKYLDIAQAHTQVLDAAVADLEAKADTTHKQKADGESFRERKLAEMESALQVVDQEIGGLEEQQAELLRQLKLVQEQISAARAKRADMEEGRHVFQEGNAFTLEALQHKVDELSTQHRHHLAENAALAECQTLMQEAASGWQATTRAAKAASQAALLQAGQEYMHAATRHLYYQRALLQLLLRQLTFCVGELQGLVEKEGSLERMGMEGIISDMRAGKQRLQAKYLEAHASAMHHFSDVAAVRTAVEAACSLPQEQALAKTDDLQGATSCHRSSAVDQTSNQEQTHSPSDSAAPSHPLAEAESQSRPRDVAGVSAHQAAAGSGQKAGLSDELLDLFESIDRLQQEVDGLQQPQGLPHASSQQELTTDQAKQSGNGTAKTAVSEGATVSVQQADRESNADQAFTEASPSSASDQVDMQLSALQLSAGQASNIASSSASIMLVCTDHLSSLYRSASGPEGTARHQQSQGAGNTHDEADAEVSHPSSTLHLQPD